MQFNPLFIPSDNVPVTHTGKTVKTLKNVNYLFADLLKVNTENVQPETSFEQLLNPTGFAHDGMLGLNKPGDGVTDYPEKFKESGQKETKAIDFSILFNILFNAFGSKEELNVNFDGSTGGSNEQSEIVIESIDKQSLIKIIKNLKEELQKNFKFTGSFRLNDNTGELITSSNENVKLNQAGIEQILNMLNENTEVSLYLKDAAVPETLFKAKKINFNFGFEKIESNYLPSAGPVDHQTKIEKNNVAGKISDKPEIIKSEINKWLEHKELNSIKNKLVEELKIEKLNEDSFKVKIKSANNSSNVVKDNPERIPLIIDQSVKQLLRNNYKLKPLRKKISGILKNADEIKINKKITEKSGGESTENKNNPTFDKPNEKNIDASKSGKKKPEFVNNHTEKVTGVSGNKSAESVPEIFNETKQVININNLTRSFSKGVNNNFSEPELINKPEVIGLVSKMLKKREKSSIEIKLNPPELGKMKVKVDYLRDRLTVKMEVENETARQLISRSIDQLKEIIHQSGIQLKEVYVSLAGGDQRQQKSSDLKKRDTSVKSDNLVENYEDESVPKMMGYNTYDYLI